MGFPLHQRQTDSRRVWITAIVTALVIGVSPLAAQQRSPTSQPTTPTAPRGTDAPRGAAGAGNGIAFGELKRGTLRRRGDTQSYKLPPVNDGDVLFAHVFDCNARGGAPINWKPLLVLKDPAGKLVADSSEYLQTSLRGIKLDGGVNYFLQLSDVVDEHQSSSGGGDFALFLQRVNNPSRTTVLKNGADETSFINSCGEIKSYSFSGEVGDQIELSLVAGAARGVYPKMEVYGPDGRFLGEAQSYDGSGSHIPPPGAIMFRSSGAGRYSVLVRSLFNDSGPYRLTLKVSKP